MAFVSTQGESFEGAGYAAAFNAEQIARYLASEYDHVEICDTAEAVKFYHSSEELYYVEIKVTKV